MPSQPNPAPMRCLAIQQPWAWAVCVGIKTVDNRTKETSHRGLVAILASTKKTNVNDLVRAFPDSDLDPNYFLYGAIIGVADLIAVEQMGPKLEANPSAYGPYCWVFKNPRLLPRPVQAKGKLNLYSLDPTESQAVQSQLPDLGRPVLDDEAQEWAAVYSLQALTDRGWHYYREKRFANALDQFNTALELNGGFIPAVSGRALTLLEQDDPATVIRDSSALLKSGPQNHIVALMLRREAYLRQDDTRRADADYTQAQALNADEAELWAQTFESLDQASIEEGE